MVKLRDGLFTAGSPINHYQPNHETTPLRSAVANNQPPTWLFNAANRVPPRPHGHIRWTCGASTLVVVRMLLETTGHPHPKSVAQRIRFLICSWCCPRKGWSLEKWISSLDFPGKNAAGTLAEYFWFICGSLIGALAVGQPALPLVNIHAISKHVEVLGCSPPNFLDGCLWATPIFPK